jgi:nitrite reductase/ring-hydroxylating ferredoxin subunit
MSNWVRVATVSECTPGSSTELVAGDRMIALFNVDGEFFALDGVCPHQGGPLGQGDLSGCVVTCPWHGWQFDVRTGQHQINQSLAHPSFPVKVENDEVLVELPAES